MFNLNLDEEGIEVGKEKGQYLLLIKLLRKKLGTISKNYINKLESLDNKKIITVALNIFNIESIEDLHRYLI